MSKKTLTNVLFVAFAVFLLLGLSESALAAKGIIKGIGTGGGSGGSITVSDLGITDVGTLPSSRWYFFKEWGRGLNRLFTFNSIKKAELEFRIANEKAAEALTIQETNPDDADALAAALKNYTKAAERLQARLAKLKETSENPNVEKLFEKLNEQTLKHAVLFNQFIKIRDTDSLPDDGNVFNSQVALDNHLQDAVDVVQIKIQEVIAAAVEKDKNIEQKAASQIALADIAIHELESELAKLKSGFIYSSQTQSAEFAINEPGVSNEKIKRTGREAGGAEGERFDCPKDCLCFPSTNTSSPNYWQGQEIFCMRESVARGHLEDAKKAFSEGKYGEAFGKARAAEVLARNGLRIIITDIKPSARGGRDADAPRIEDVRSGMPIVPGTDKSGEKIVPEIEKRVFPETNNRVFPETNNRTACDDKQAPGCLRGEILECHSGKWICIGPATGGGIIGAPENNPASSDGSIKSSE